MDKHAKYHNTWMAGSNGMYRTYPAKQSKPKPNGCLMYAIMVIALTVGIVICSISF